MLLKFDDNHCKIGVPFSVFQKENHTKNRQDKTLVGLIFYFELLQTLQYFFIKKTKLAYISTQDSL